MRFSVLILLLLVMACPALAGQSIHDGEAAARKALAELVAGRAVECAPPFELK